MLRNFIKKFPTLYSYTLHFFIIYKNCYFYLRDEKNRKSYYEQIEQIKKDKEIVIDLDHGGLGDALVFTGLPRLLKEKYDISFYLSKRSLDKLRHHDIFKLCFKMNPYFCGTKEVDYYFNYRSFLSEQSLYTFITGKGGDNIPKTLEKQFNLEGNALPEIYYTPVIRPELRNTVLVDKNWIFGKTHNLHYNKNLLEEEIQKAQGEKGEVLYVEPKTQSLFEYVDMISSSKYFVALISGGNALVAALNKPASIIIPEDLEGGALSNFFFHTPKIKYIRKKSLNAYFSKV